MDDDTKKNLTDRGIWLRLVHILVFVVAFNIAEVLIAAVTVFQFLSKLITRDTNRNLADFGQNLATYVYQVILFLTFRSDDKPFPFGPWPSGAPTAEAAVPAKKRGRAKSAGSRGSKAAPHGPAGDANEAPGAT